MDITSSQTMQQCVIFLYNRSLLLTNILLKRVVTGPGMYDENTNGYLSTKQLTEMSNTHQRSTISNIKVYRITKYTFLSTVIKYTL